MKNPHISVKTIRSTVETKEISIPNTYIHDRSHSWFGTGT